jgi:hypothetical protein
MHADQFTDVGGWRLNVGDGLKSVAKTIGRPASIMPRARGYRVEPIA